MLALGCRDASEGRAHLVVGTFWAGAGEQALQRELIRIAHDLGPVNIEVRKTTGIESTPTRTACRSHSLISNGGRTDQAAVRQSMLNHSPVSSKRRMKTFPMLSRKEVIH